MAAPTAPPAAATPSGLVALARSGLARVNAPLTSLPADAVFGSDTLRSASPAVETTVACDEAAYVFATPGVNAPNVAGAPSVSESVAGTVPPTSPRTGVSVGPLGTSPRRSPGWQ